MRMRRARRRRLRRHQSMGLPNPACRRPLAAAHMGGSKRVSTFRKKLPCRRRGAASARRGIDACRYLSSRGQSQALQPGKGAGAREARRRAPAERGVIHAARVVRGVLAQGHLPEAAADLVAALADLDGDDFARHAGSWCARLDLRCAAHPRRCAQRSAAVDGGICRGWLRRKLTRSCTIL